MSTFLITANFTHGYRSNRMEIYANYSLFHKALGHERQAYSGDSYQIRESLTAISQGGLFGTGSEGGRAKHMFLPDVNSDYIFAMIGEQFGFIGGIIIIFLFSVFLFRSLLVSASADSYFKMLLVMGMGINIFITAIVNMGVSMSALPSTGLALPFISHGGSALVVNLGMLAVILNISSQRKIS
jgi:cell division protein FtsW (lipid II flippase)